MQEPRWENARIVAEFRATDVCIERFPEDCTDGREAYRLLVKLVGDLRYEGYIRSKKNSYQIDFNFDDKLHARACAEGQDCANGPVLSAPREVARAVGRKADTLLRVPGAGNAVVVEVEKANREKILRDIVKMLLFFEARQADLAVLMCPRNYVHRRGVWRVFDTARQVLRAFVRVTELPEAKVKRLALIGFTKEVFLDGKWTVWDIGAREKFQAYARKHFEAAV
ncbi:MAG: hypothetical protein WBE37_32125 [Bryobacteraceae bacterium]